MVPRGTDPAIVRVLERAIENVTKSEAYMKKVHDIGSLPLFIGSQAAADYIANEAKAVEKVATQAGIKPE